MKSHHYWKDEHCPRTASTFTTHPSSSGARTKGNRTGRTVCSDPSKDAAGRPAGTPNGVHSVHHPPFLHIPPAIPAPTSVCLLPLLCAYYPPPCAHYHLPCALLSWPSQQGFLSSSALRQKLFSVPLVCRMSRPDPGNFMTWLLHFHREQCLKEKQPPPNHPPSNPLPSPFLTKELFENLKH